MSDQQVVFNTRFATAWILILVALLFIAWDLYARQFPGATISEELLWLSHHPVVPFVGGILGGHLFWPQVEKRD